METILFVFLLNIQSSYLRDSEVPSKDPADTVQFILLNGRAWRIKTFAQDYDVHVWNLGVMDRVSFEALALANTEKNYGDVLAGHVRIAADSGMQALAAAVKASSLGGALEVAQDRGFAFWVSSPGLYTTKSTPR